MFVKREIYFQGFKEVKELQICTNIINPTITNNLWSIEDDEQPSDHSSKFSIVLIIEQEKESNHPAESQQ